MNDPIDGLLRQLVQELSDAAPPPHDWDDVAEPRARGPRRRSLWLVAATAAVVAVGGVSVGIAVTRSRPRSPATVHDTTPRPVETTTATIAPTTSAETSSSSVPATTAASELPTIAVSYRDPPTALDLRPFATIDLPVGSSGPASLPPIAALDGGRAAVVDSDSGQIIVVDQSGQHRIRMTIAPGPFLVIGGHDVLYGIAQQPTPGNAAGAVVVAIALTGDRAGSAVASAPVGILPYTEVAATVLGDGEKGIIDRNTGEQLLAYADTNGGLRALDVAPPNYRLGDDGVVRTAQNDTSWALAIERHPDYRGTFVTDPPPADIGDGRALYWTAIGPPVDPTQDHPDPTLKVVAILEPDGTGTWYSLASGWSVVASDPSGVIFARRVDATIELALLPATGITSPPVTESQVQIPSGNLVVGAKDLFIVHDDGDLWLHPGLLGGPGAPPIRLADLADPRVPAPEGPGPNTVDQVAGEVNGAVYYGDCCEPIAGNVWAAIGPDSERLSVGYGFSPVISPDRQRLASANNFAISVTDLAHGVAKSRPINEDGSSVNEADLVWTADGRSLIMLVFDDKAFSLVTYDADTLTAGDPVEIGVTFDPASRQVVRFAGRGANGEIALTVGNDQTTEIRFFDGTTLAEIPDLRRSLPGGVTSVRLGADGQGVLWIDNGTLWYEPPGGDARSLGDGFMAAWFATE